MWRCNTILEQNSKLLELCSKHGLIDIMYKQNEFLSFATYSRGYNRIAFSLISETLFDGIDICEYTPFCDICIQITMDSLYFFN